MNSEGARPGAARIFIGLLLLCLVTGGLYYGRKASGKAIAGIEQYPYRTPRFSQLVAESYQHGDAGDPRDFYRELEAAFARSPLSPSDAASGRLTAFLAAKRTGLQGERDPARRAASERELGARVHALTRGLFPRVDPDRGFEFWSAVHRGERQPFLQSVLSAALLQAMGVDAGVVMVYRNDRGEESNLGHAVTLVKLSSGRDLLLDASRPEPFVRLQGVLARAPWDRYVAPIYAGGSPEIAGYRAADGARIETARVRDLSYNFVRSQFWYYRGERAPGGPLADARTPEGLEAASRALRTSTKIYRNHALALYMLGRVEWDQGRRKEARNTFARACALYQEAGRLPEEPKRYLALAGGPLTGEAGAP